ncbi:MAG: hypothetical protein V1901_03940 [Patescibacteria group bacterium]
MDKINKQIIQLKEIIKKNPINKEQKKAIETAKKYLAELERIKNVY